MAPRKTQRQLADAAWIKAQQIDLTNQVEASPVAEPPFVEGMPGRCPDCDCRWTVQAGVTPSLSLLTVQCGNCGNHFSVTEDEHQRLRVAIREHFAARAAANAPLPKPKRGKRVRGAG